MTENFLLSNRFLSKHNRNRDRFLQNPNWNGDRLFIQPKSGTAIAFYKNQNRNRARFFIKLELERRSH